METYLRGLLTSTSTARNPHDGAIELQREYEELVDKEEEIKKGASKGRHFSSIITVFCIAYYTKTVHLKSLHLDPSWNECVCPQAVTNDRQLIGQPVGSAGAIFR